ncbi:unnamed protein product [Meganyctiphanes norvegica]|uniref:Uncharacterized protein n=1 Tax=Meganyctiphanes norvegica TaxID=48144 RepID=A0AAV2QL02_MEGNR
MCVNDVLEARTGDMSMGRNLRAARCLDFTDKDDDDGLNRADSDCEEDPENYKKKGDEEDDDAASITSTEGELTPKTQVISRNGNRIINSNTFPRRNNNFVSGQKRPLEGCVVAACQEIQYLDISYQKVSTVTVQFSPIPRKKIAYHPVLHSHINYCDVTYIAPGEKDPTTTPTAVRRKPQRSQSFAGLGERGLREKLATQPFIRSEWASGISRVAPQCLRAAAVAVSTEYSR